LKSIVGLSGPPGQDPEVAKTWILAHLLMTLLLEPLTSAPEISPRLAAWRRRLCGGWLVLPPRHCWRRSCLYRCRSVRACLSSSATWSNLRENDVIKQSQPYVSAYAAQGG